MPEPIEGVIFDLEGVLVTANLPLPGAIETLHALESAHIPFQILSNMTLWPRRSVLERLHAWGLDLPLDRMLTPPAAAARWLAQNGNPRTIAFVAEPTRLEFEGLNLVEEGANHADVVVIGDMGDKWNAAALNRALRLLLKGARLLALGMGRYWNGPEGLRLDVGGYVSALAYATGQTPLVFGKPSPEYFLMAVDALGVPRERTVMVGDDILNDVRGAQEAGLRGALVQTGKFRTEDLEQDVAPDWVLSDVTGVRQWFRLPA